MAATICLLVVTGCRESAQQPSERTTTTGSSNATASDPNSGSSLAEGGDVPQLEKSSGGYQTAIRLEPLPLKQFPEVIPDNGARHGFATILESLGSGCAAVDFDRDDLPDAIIAGGGDFVERMCVGRPVHFLRNRRTHFEDTTNCSGIGTTRYYHTAFAPRTTTVMDLKIFW